MKSLLYVILPVFVFLVGCSNNNPTNAIELQTPIVNQSFSIISGGFQEYSFPVDLATQSDVTLKGSFSTDSGTVTVLVLTEENFITWQASGSYNAVQAFNDVVSGELDLGILGSGTYHLIFNNQSDGVNSKNVTADVNLVYFVEQ